MKYKMHNENRLMIIPPEVVSEMIVPDAIRVIPKITIACNLFG